MKNAMKKLFSLALAAMLLVSVVPMGAMAATMNVPVTVVADGQELIPTQNMPLADDMTLTALIQTLVSNHADYNVLTYKSGEGVTDPTTATVQGATSIRFELTSQNAEVTIRFENGASQKAYFPVTGTLTIGSDLLKKAGLVVPAGKKIAGWNYNGPVSEGTVVDVNHGMSPIVCLLTDAATGGGSGSVDSKYSYSVTYYDAAGQIIGQENKECAPNTEITVSHPNFVSMMVSGGQDLGNGKVKITSNQATIDVFTSVNSQPSGNTKYYYSVTVYDWNGKVIKDTNWYDATPGQTVTVQADNFYEMKVNGSIVPNRGNSFVINQDNAKVEVRTTVNNGNVNPNPNPNPTPAGTVNVYFKGADKTSTVYTTTVVKGNSIGHDAVMTAKNAVGEKSGYNFAGWQRNGEGSTLASETVAYTTQTNDVTYYPVFTPKSSKFVNDIYLNIFVNGKADIPAKSIKLNDYTIISDDVINLDEVLTVVDDYYKASNTNKGLQLDGLYVAKGNFVSNWATDSGKSSSISGLKAMRYDSVVGINVMVNNAVAKTSSNADSSNPKTGDDIYMTVTVMGLSAAALCAVYYISKKRAVC